MLNRIIIKTNTTPNEFNLMKQEMSRLVKIRNRITLIPRQTYVKEKELKLI